MKINIQRTWKQKQVGIVFGNKNKLEFLCQECIPDKADYKKN
jgi:hypothetical protein